MSDRRWIVLAPDGRMVTLGRATDPIADELARAKDGLGPDGGWLAVQEHSLHRKKPPGFVMVRALGEPVGSFEDAVAALLAGRT